MESEEYFCVYCMEVSELREVGECCPHCRMGVCAKCGERLKPDSTFCFGCGIIRPEIRARFSRSSSTGSAYAVEEWKRQGLSRTRRELYHVMTGWKPGENQATVKPRTWLVIAHESGEYDDVRELTAEEVALLNRKPAPAPEAKTE